MILFYRILTNLLYPVIVIIIFLRKFFNKEDKVRYKEKIFPSKFKAQSRKDLKLIWFQAASIGEFKSILPVIEQINKDHDDLEFLITTTTLSSSNLAIKELNKFKNVQHRFFPIDVKFVVEKFLSEWQPSVIFFVDSEIWPNLIMLAKEKEIPLAIINARITSKTFKRWMLVPKIAKEIFNSFNLCLASSMESKKYLTELDAKNIFYYGNLKLISYSSTKKLLNFNEEILKSKKFWLGVSTHKGEENLCINTHLKLREKFKNLLTIIAPRHIERVNDIKKLCENYHLNTQILDNNKTISNYSEIVIINSFGNLPTYFKHAQSVFIGKSTIKKLEQVSGQSPIDAAKSGCKIYHGPYVYNFKEIYKILEENNISKIIHNSSELSEYLINDLENLDQKNREFPLLIENLGQKTLTDTMKNINNLINEIK